MKQDKIPLIDELFDSCRLLPEPISLLLFWGVLGPISLVYPIFVFPYYIALAVLAAVILVLLQKYIVFLWISKMENAIAKRIIWIYTKNDSRQLNFKKITAMLSVCILSCACFFWLDGKAFVLLGLLCVVLFLKVFFYVPVLDIRLIDKDRELAVNDIKKLKTITLPVYGIRKVIVFDSKIQFNYLEFVNQVRSESDPQSISEQSVTEFEIQFASKAEKDRVFEFLTGLDLFKVVRK